MVIGVVVDGNDEKTQHLDLGTTVRKIFFPADDFAGIDPSIILPKIVVIAGGG